MIKQFYIIKKKDMYCKLCRQQHITVVVINIMIKKIIAKEK